MRIMIKVVKEHLRSTDILKFITCHEPLPIIVKINVNLQFKQLGSLPTASVRNSLNSQYVLRIMH